MKITRLNTHFHYNIKRAYVPIHNPFCRKWSKLNPVAMEIQATYIMAQNKVDLYTVNFITLKWHWQGILKTRFLRQKAAYISTGNG